MPPQQTSENERVLVYHHHANGSPVVKKGIALITRAELDSILVNRKSFSLSSRPPIIKFDSRC